MLDLEHVIDIDADGTSNISATGSNVNLDSRGKTDDHVSVWGAYASVYTNAGDDKVYVHSAAADVDTGAGDDYAEVWAVGATIDMGSGNNHLVNYGGYNQIDSGDGNDEIESYGAYSNIETRGGDDNIVATGVGVFVDAGTGNNEVLTIAGGAVIDTDGGGTNDILAFGGANWITTEAGSDLVVSMSLGGNYIRTGEGDDYIVAVAGLLNIVAAGEGDDVAMVLSSANLVMGGEGDDTIMAVGAGNLLVGGSTNDLEGVIDEIELAVSGDGQDQSLKTDLVFDRWDTGDDVLIGIGGYNTILSGDGDDHAIGVGIANEIHGDAGNDYVLAVGAKNDLSGDTGDDVILALGATNQIFGGGDNDLTMGIGLANILVTDGDGKTGAAIKAVAYTGKLAAEMLEYAYDTIAGNDVESPDFSGYLAHLDAIVDQEDGGDDTAIGLGLGNVILTGHGNDSVLAAGAGNFVYAGAGDDSIAVAGMANVVFGDEGRDIIVDFGLKSEIYGGADNDLIVGSGFGLFTDYFHLVDHTMSMFGDALAEMMEQLGDTLSGVVGGSELIAQRLGLAEEDEWAGAEDKIDRAFDDVASALQEAFDSIATNDDDDEAETILEVYEDPGKIEQFLSDLWDDVVGLIDDGAEGFASIIHEMADALPSMVGGDGEDVIVSGFGLQTISGGAGVDTYVMYENEGIDYIYDEEGRGDTVEFRFDENSEDSFTLSDIAFEMEGDTLVISGAFTTFIDNQADIDAGVENLLLTMSDGRGFTLDLDGITQKLLDTGDEDAMFTLSDLLQTEDSGSAFTEETTLDEFMDTLDAYILADSGEIAGDMVHADLDYVMNYDDGDVDHSVTMNS